MLKHNKQITFSIIIPTCNAGETLVRCLDSIVIQDYPAIEIWIIDNASTDNTLSIITQYQSKHAFINLISEPDNGIYDAMNKGIKLCNGEWIYFMGSDDTLYDKSVLSSIANTTNVTNAEIIYGNVIIRGDNQWNLNNVIFNGEYNLEKILELTINHQAMFYQRIVFEKYGFFNVKYKTNADYDLNLKFFASTSFHYINIIVANFFVGGQSTWLFNDGFHEDQGALLLKYFGKKIFSKSFINTRLHLQRAALSKRSPLNLPKRMICLFAYIKLKFQASFI